MKTKISEWSTTPASNTDIDGINIAEGCAPSGINDAIRDLMAQVRSWQSGASGDPFNGPMNGTIGATTAYSGAFTTVSATGVITSTLATGTAPLTIASTTKVTNLNADLLDGADWASPAALGSTTPAAVSATTLSASGAVTISGGTANGVTYLNGSKVLTSGSALTFDGTNLGVGTASPGNKLTISDSGALSIQISSALSGGSNLLLTANGSGGELNMVNGLPLIFKTSNSEQMRLTSTGLGIGTSSPGYRLTAAGASTAGSVTALAIENPSSNAASEVRQEWRAGGTTFGYVTVSYNSNSPYMAFATGQSPISEQMRLTSTGLGIGTSSPATRLQVTTGATGVQALFSHTSGTPTIAVGNSTTTYNTQIGYNVGSEYGYIQATAAAGVYDDIAINPLGGNVGIGTSSPAFKLQVEGAANSAALTLLRLNNSGTTSGGPGIASRISFTAGATALGYIQGSNFASGAAGLQFSGDGTNAQATLDSAGNLGLGVTPSAWKSGAKAFQLGATGYASLNEQANGSTSLNFNCYESAANTWTYYVTGVAPTRYTQLSGTHAWYTAASGTAGTAISFTQAMTLDASGRLGVGNTSPTNTIHAGSSSASSTGILAACSGSSFSKVQVDSFGFGSLGVFSNNSGSTQDGVPTGTVGLGTAGAVPLVLTSNGTERARIDSSGNLLWGTTSSGGNNTTGAALIYNSGSSYASWGHITGTGSGTGFHQFLYAGGVIGSITQSGTTAVLYNVTSDQRLKENIVDAPEFGSVIDSIQVRSFDWKADGTHQRAGFIAQELVTVAPEAVHQPVDTEEMMAVDYSKLVPMLVKEIQSLRQRVAQLETN